MGRAPSKCLLIPLLAFAVSACLSESDDEAIRLSITTPASTSSIDTTDASVVLAGSAESESGITLVSWESDRGDQGVAEGTASWQTESIALQIGENRITVTAEDASGETASRSMVVNRESGEKSAVTLSWQAPTSRADGSPLTNLAGYVIHYGRMSEVYDYRVDVSNPGIVTYVVEDLVSGDWYFALSAYDTDGLESEHSDEVLRHVD